MNLVGDKLETELLAEHVEQSGHHAVRQKMCQKDVAIEQRVDGVIYKHHTAERLLCGEEGVLQGIAEIGEHPAQHRRDPDEGGDVIARGKDDHVGILGILLGALEGIIETNGASGGDAALGIHHLQPVNETALVAEIDQERKDGKIGILISEQGLAESYALADSGNTRDYLACIDIGKLHILDAREELALIEADCSGNLFLAAGTEHCLAATQDKGTILNDAGDVGFGLGRDGKAVGPACELAVAVGVGQLYRQRVLAIVVEEKVGALDLKLCAWIEVVGKTRLGMDDLHGSIESLED